MKVAYLKIENFRGIKSAEIHFKGHTLLIGGNNVGKSTICEALDLVLGPDRMNRSPAVEEYDFYNACYKDADGKAIPICVQVVLIELSEEVKKYCGNHLEFWHVSEKRLLKEGEIDAVDKIGQPCLNLIAKGWYDGEEDEFEAKTYFAHSPDAEEGELTPVNRNVKRMFGFLYLRTLRTGSRALSLERGSLLDIILRTKGARSGLWEATRQRLKTMQPPIDQGASELLAILKEIERKLSNYIQLTPSGRATELYVSKLTREHLRQTMSFFLSVTPDQVAVPFQQVGTGTLNTLVLALLTFIGEIKKDNVIFAMEEPEIALPPHTQRRIAKYLLENTTQSFVTTHSPYIIELFDPEQITILNRTALGQVTGTEVTLSTGLKAKTYRKHVRRGLAEAMLARGVIVAEGITEICVLQECAAKMEAADKARVPFDLTGITMITADGDGNLAEIGKFFKGLGIPDYGFFDMKKSRKTEDKKALEESFNISYETGYTGMEDLLVTEVPLQHLWTFLCSFREKDIEGKLGIPEEKPEETKLRKLATDVLKACKGDGRAGSLIELCSDKELPKTVVAFLGKIYDLFKQAQPKESAIEKESTVGKETVENGA